MKVLSLKASVLALNPSMLLPVLAATLFAITSAQIIGVEPSRKL